MVSKDSRKENRLKKHQRIRNRFAGTAECPRLAVFRSNKHMYAQIIDDDNGVTLVSANTLQKDVKADLQKTDDVEAAPAPVQSTQPGKSTKVFSKIKSALFSYLGLLLIAYFFLWLTPLWEKVDRDYTGKDFGLYAAAFGIGFAVLAGLPLASIILMITGFGLRPAFVLLLVYSAVLTAAPVFLGFFLGSQLWRKALKKTKNYWAELAVGLLVWRILSLIPGVKIVTAFIAGPLALGVITRMLGKKKAGPAPAEEHPALPEQNLA
jgi:hypothetical protein